MENQFPDDNLLFCLCPDFLLSGWVYPRVVFCALVNRAHAVEGSYFRRYVAEFSALTRASLPLSDPPPVTVRFPDCTLG